jgi:hypothetical protein
MLHALDLRTRQALSCTLRDDEGSGKEAKAREDQRFDKKREAEHLNGVRKRLLASVRSILGQRNRVCAFLESGQDVISFPDVQLSLDGEDGFGIRDVVDLNSGPLDFEAIVVKAGRWYESLCLQRRHRQSPYLDPRPPVAIPICPLPCSCLHKLCNRVGRSYLHYHAGYPENNDRTRLASVYTFIISTGRGNSQSRT